MLAIPMLLNNPRAGIRVGSLYSDLWDSQWHSHTDLEQIQASKLTCLLSFARDNVPFYAKYPPLTRRQGDSLRDSLTTYPILTKDAFRKNSSSLQPVSGPTRGSYKCTTGGTTGKPIEVWCDKHHVAIVEAAYWRGLSWVGLTPLSRGVSARSMGRGSWYGRMRLRLANKMLVDGFAKGPPETDEIAASIARFSPEYITGYVSTLVALSRSCRDAGVRACTVVATGEMLYEHQRQQLEESYGGRVCEYYGCNEVGSLAYECESGRKHVVDEHVLLEVVDDAGCSILDEPGRIVVTDLDNFITPLIRYELGDIGILSSEVCPCGRSLTVLKSIQGRTQDGLVNEAGAILTTLFFAARFRGLESLQRIQLIQKGLRDIDLLYERGLGTTQSDIEAIVGEIHERLGPQMHVTPKQVERLVSTSRGKCRLIVPLDPDGVTPANARPG